MEDYVGRSAASRPHHGNSNGLSITELEFRHARAKNVLAAIERFGKHPSPELERFLRPQEVLIARLHEEALSRQDRLLILDCAVEKRLG